MTRIKINVNRKGTKTTTSENSTNPLVTGKKIKINPTAKRSGALHGSLKFSAKKIPRLEATVRNIRFGLNCSLKALGKLSCDYLIPRGGTRLSL